MKLIDNAFKCFFLTAWILGASISFASADTANTSLDAGQVSQNQCANETIHKSLDTACCEQDKCDEGTSKECQSESPGETLKPSGCCKKSKETPCKCNVLCEDECACSKVDVCCLTCPEKMATSVDWKNPYDIEVSGLVKTFVQVSNDDNGTFATAAVGIERAPNRRFPVGFGISTFAASSFQRNSSGIVNPDDDIFHRYGFGMNEFSAHAIFALWKASSDEKQAYVPTLQVGRFDARIGIENNDKVPHGGSGGTLYAKDFLPSNHTGAALNVKFKNDIKAGAYIVTGWNETINDGNKDLSVGANVRYPMKLEKNPDPCKCNLDPCACKKKKEEYGAIGLGYYGGKEGGCDLGNEENGTYGRIAYPYQGSSDTHLFNGYAFGKFGPNKKCTIAGEYLYAQASSPNKGKWNGFGIYGLYELSKKFTLGGRYDQGNDPNGLVIAKKLPDGNLMKGTIRSYTTVLKYKIDQTRDLRLEVRHNTASVPIYADNKRNETILSFLETYKLK